MKSEARIPFFLIWKFLLRSNKWTLCLIIFLMSVAFINLIFITSLFNGIIDGANKQIINTYTGNITVTPRDGQDFIDNTPSVISKIEQNSNVIAAANETLVPGSLKYKNIKGSWQIDAINPDQESKVTTVASKMIAGDYLDANDLDQIIIGKQVAGGKDTEMDAFSFKDGKVGDKVTLSVAGQEKEFTIKGIFETRFIQTDERTFITEKALTALLPTAKDKSTNIVIKTDKTGDENTVIEELKSSGLNQNFFTWQDASGIMISVTKSFVSINVIMTFVGILIAAVTIFIVIYVEIINKKRQIGILRAIGIKSYLIVFTYILQTAIYSVFGVLFGTALFYFIIVPYFLAHPFVLPICDAVLVTTPANYIARAETIMWVSLIAGMIPAITTTRIKMIDAILGK